MMMMMGGCGDVNTIQEVAQGMCCRQYRATPTLPKKGSAKPKASPGGAQSSLQGKAVKGTRTKG